MSIVYKTRTQLVVETIREKILCGDIQAGQPLRQAALAQELNVSRIPIREALLQLEGEGLVTFEAHKGATATELTIDQVDELFDLRAMLEVELLKASIPHLTENNIVDAKIILAELDNALSADNGANTWSDLNVRYHSCLYSGAVKPQTQELVNTLSKNTNRYIRMHLLLVGGIANVEVEHTTLLSLCQDGDIDGAASLLKQHILGIKNEIKHFLQQQENSLKLIS